MMKFWDKNAKYSHLEEWERFDLFEKMMFDLPNEYYINLINNIKLADNEDEKFKRYYQLYDEDHSFVIKDDGTLIDLADFYDEETDLEDVYDVIFEYRTTEKPEWVTEYIEDLQDFYLNHYLKNM